MAKPVGAPGSEVLHPAPVPAKPATRTTPTRAVTLAAVDRFCAQRPAATPTRFRPVTRPISTMPRRDAPSAGQPSSRARYSPLTTPMAAMAAQ
jgi:hypothetical protein